MGFRNANQGIFNTGGIKLFPNFSNGSVGVSENADIADTLSVGIRNQLAEQTVNFFTICVEVNNQAATSQCLSDCVVLELALAYRFG